MSETKTQIVLTNNSNHPLVAKVLDRIGTTVECITCDHGDDDIEISYQFPDDAGSVGIVGDNAIGAVIGAYISDNDNLILIANFGDDGDYFYNVEQSTHLQILKLEDL